MSNSHVYKEEYMINKVKILGDCHGIGQQKKLINIDKWYSQCR